MTSRNVTTTDDVSYTTYTRSTVGLAKWPLADAGFTSSLASAVTIKGADNTEVTEVNWENGTVTLEVTYDDTEADDHIADGMELQATYSYVKAEQTIEVEVDKPVRLVSSRRAGTPRGPGRSSASSGTRRVRGRHAHRPSR